MAPIIAVFLVVAGVVWLVHAFFLKERILSGLLVDLELNGPAPDRHAELRKALTVRLPAEEPELKGIRVSLQYAHFTELARELLKPKRPDFIILSPQGTPWISYEGLDAYPAAKVLVRELALSTDTPILGICGGHQFLAMACGGSVGFIDRRFSGTRPERYPREAIAERGMVALQTLAADPILEGVATHPGSFVVAENHYEEVKSAPPPLVNLARSPLSEIQMIRLPGKTVYGVAFHPERGWDAQDPAESGIAGRRLLANFLIMAYRNK